MRRPILAGILWAVVGAFPMAALFALCYRFPIPFSGYESGLSAALPAALAVLYYGLMGGFVVLAAIGAASGMVGRRMAGERPERCRRLVVGLAFAGDFFAILSLSILDKLIGAW